MVIGADTELPKSISFKSGVLWSYQWQESKFENGVYVPGHLVMVPASQWGEGKNESK
ncbi:MAG: hypothetical protein KDD45_04720 [Bdellovibrionales bacterium]|nr:hypothetical protein [Bdellovibrionales bacterium]